MTWRHPHTSSISGRQNYLDCRLALCVSSASWFVTHLHLGSFWLSSLISFLQPITAVMELQTFSARPQNRELFKIEDLCLELQFRFSKWLNRGCQETLRIIIVYLIKELALFKGHFSSMQTHKGSSSSSSSVNSKAFSVSRLSSSTNCPRPLWLSSSSSLESKQPSVNRI